MPNLRLPPYHRLLEIVHTTLEEGRLRAEQAVQHERLGTYHQVGRQINDHLLSEKRRAEYGERLIRQLAEDLGVNHAILYDALQLSRAFPIVYAHRHLGWSHYRAVLRLPDQEDREALLSEAEREGWPTRELEKQVRQRLPGMAPGLQTTPGARALPPLEPLRGLIDVCRVVDLKSGGGRVLDLGFTLYHPPDEIGIDALPSGAVRLDRLGPARYTIRSTRSQKATHYSYLARVERVIDGDTLLLQIHAPIRTIVRQRVRLRGIDTPEMGRPEGERAKAFAEQILRGHEWIGITSTKPDAYDRYLVDIFVPNENDRDQAILDHGLFLNQLLVNEGLAERVDY